MHSEVMDVIIRALIEDDIKKIQVALDTGAGMGWLRGILEDGTCGYANHPDPDLIDEFQSRGLELVAVERKALASPSNAQEKSY